MTACLIVVLGFSFFMKVAIYIYFSENNPVAVFVVSLILTFSGNKIRCEKRPFFCRWSITSNKLPPAMWRIYRTVFYLYVFKLYGE